MLFISTTMFAAGEQAATAPNPAAGMSLTTTFGSTNLYVGQPVTLSVAWSSPKQFRRCWELQLDLPLLHDQAWEIYPIVPDVPEKQRIGIPVSGQRMIAVQSQSQAGERLEFSYMLIPRLAGTHQSPEARLQCALMKGNQPATPYPSYFDNHFFRSPEANDEFQSLSFTAPIPRVTVQSLPEEDRTPRFTSVVGTCKASATIEPKETAIGQPMLFTVTLEGLHFSGHIDGLPAAALDDLGPEFQLTSKPLRVTTAPNAKSFTYVLRPLRSTVRTVPAIALQSFDPKQRTYQTVRTKPLPITIHPDGEQTVYQPHRTEDATPPHPLNGIRGNRNESETLMRTYLWIECLARYAWLLWILPPLAWLILRPWLRRLDRCRVDPAYCRAVNAARRFRRTCSRDEETAWRTYLADRFDQTASAVTFESIAGELDRRDVPQDLVGEIRNRFARQDSEHYSPAGSSPTPPPAAKDLVRRLETVARVLLVPLACLCLVSNSHASTPEARFDQAIQLRADKPDEARPLFVEAAFEFEAERSYINAGNSWFFAGKPGRALAAYRAAQRLRPFNRHLRESIAFIRTQRADVFNPGTSRRSRVALGWQRFCQWTPALRGSLLTIIYLAAWTVFLTSRFAGKSVPRRFWFAIGIVALIPATSLVQSRLQPEEGVIIEAAEARLGPGYAYAAAYEHILHEATEFQWMEARNGWILARLPDGNEAWLRDTACIKH